MNHRTRRSDRAWQDRNRKSGMTFAGPKYRMAGKALDPEERTRIFDSAVIAAQDAFGDRFELNIDPKRQRITVGKKLDLPGLSPLQQAANELLKRDQILRGDEFNRSYETTPSSLNSALIEAAQYGMIPKGSIDAVISGGGVPINEWADKVIFEKFGQTGQEMGSGIDVMHGGPVFTDDVDKGHIYAGEKYPHKAHMPRNTRVESKSENRGYQDFEGEALLDTIDNRLYGIKDTSAAYRLGRQGMPDIEYQELRERYPRRAGGYNESAIAREVAERGTREINELEATLKAQMIVDSVPFEQQGAVMKALGMVAPGDID